MSTTSRRISRSQLTTKEKQMSRKFRTQADEASTVFATLKNIEAMIQAAELEQIGQGKKSDDVMGAGPGGDQITYAGRVSQLEKQKEAVVKANSDLMSIVSKLADREAEQQRQALEG
jgi:oligoribonuclease NrnB/cAMP/cGMP phosphodiesterase (DHH superfamily)